MNKPSKSPDRYKFQRHGYVKRCEDKGEDPNPDYLDLFDKMVKDSETKWDDPAAREHNLEWDIVTTDWILSKVRSSDIYAQHLYAALCNQTFQKNDVWPALKNQQWGCSWRSAGGIVADMRGQGDYMDWYCSGITGGADFSQEQTELSTQYVSEGTVTEEIRTDLFELGWIVIDNEV